MMQDQMVGLLIPFIALTFAITFFVLWRWGPATRYVLNFSASFVALAVGFLVFHYTPLPDARLVFVTSHLMYGTAMLFMVAGVTARAEVHLSLPFVGTVQLVAAGLIALSDVADVTPRLLAMNTAYGICFGLLAFVLFQKRAREPVDHMIRIVFAILAVQNFTRPIIGLIMEGKMSAAEFRASPFYAATAFLIAALSLLLALSFIYAVVSDNMRAFRAEAERDRLTGLLMRGPLEDRARGAIRRGSETGRSLSVIVADIDHFKSVNDRWGHQAGDAAIAAFGKLIGNMVRAGDLAGRVGGEEFCIVVDDCEEDAATGLAERIRKRFGSVSHGELGEGEKLTASFGVAEMRPGESYRDLFARADAALYDAKKQGRNRTCSG